MRAVSLAVALGAVAAALSVAGCGDSGSPSSAANEVVRQRIESLEPAANLGHRGTGPTREGHPFPENSLPSLREAMEQGADGVEIDVELTADGELIVMHDDTLDRTTICSGCVSALTLDAVRDCFLVDGDGVPTEERPPTLAEVYDLLPPDALVNVELKVFGLTCGNETNGPRVLARTAVEEVHRLGATERTLFSSFNEEAAVAVKEEDPGLYSARLLLAVRADTIDRARQLGLDAIHPFQTVAAADVAAAGEAGLQVNIWTVNAPEAMNENLDKGVTAIITDEPAVLVEVLATRR